MGEDQTPEQAAPVPAPEAAADHTPLPNEATPSPDQTPAPDIKTQAEMLARMRVRQRPAYEKHLVPGGHITEQVHKLVRDTNERRIGKLRERLNNAREGLETDYALKSKHGHARTDFEQNR